MRRPEIPNCTAYGCDDCERKLTIAPFRPAAIDENDPKPISSIVPTPPAASSGAVLTTPDTPVNELRQQLETRIAEADKRFRFGKTPGSQTDHGQIYVLAKSALSDGRS